mgnify:CR=1 FL=1
MPGRNLSSRPHDQLQAHRDCSAATTGFVGITGSADPDPEADRATQ